MNRLADRTWKTPLPVLFNASAGRGGGRAASAIRRAFREARIAVDLIEAPPEETAARVREAVESGARTVGIAGGDGTMASAAAELVDGPAALLPIPTGTMNSFARGLGIGSVRAAARAARDGAVEEVSVGRLEGRIFLNTATVGPYARVVRLREVRPQPLGRELATIAAAWSVLRESPAFDATLAADGDELDGPFLLVWAGVWRRSPGPRVPRAPRDPATELEVIAFAAAADEDADESGDDERRRVARRRWTEFTVRAPRRLDLTLDGEALSLDPPVRIGISPAALRVVRRDGR